MNVVDYIILGVIGISVLFGMYRGFVSSVLNLLGGMASFLGAFWLYPKATELIQNNETLQKTLAHYLEPGSGLDLTLSRSSVAALDASGIQNVLSEINLPAPLDSILQVNMENSVFTNLDISTVGEYVNQTILQSSVNILCFAVCFILMYFVVSCLFNMIRAIFHFPVLKQLDSVAGGVFGVLRGLLLCLTLFSLAPLVQTMVPLEMVDTALEQSVLAPIFMNGNLVTAIMNGQL